MRVERLPDAGVALGADDEVQQVRRADDGHREAERKLSRLDDAFGGVVGRDHQQRSDRHRHRQVGGAGGTGEAAGDVRGNEGDEADDPGNGDDDGEEGAILKLAL